MSGIAGGNFNAVSQVGSGSFAETIGVQYPFNERRTAYARFGSSALLLLWLPIVGLYPIRKSFLGQAIASGYELVHGRSRETSSSTSVHQPLIDV